MAKLFLYSDQIPPITDPIDERLFAMLPRIPRIGYLPASPDSDRTWFKDRQTYYARYGATLEFFGLEKEFQPDQIPDLFQCDAIHLTGGNTFRFSYWLQTRGLFDHLKRYVASGGVLIGVSAGAIMMTPDISSSAYCGDEPYPALQNNDGLSLVDFEIIPHIESQDDLTEFAKLRPRMLYGIPDGSAIIIDNDQMEFIGPIFQT